MSRRGQYGKRQRQRGFTLIELLVAISILAIVAVLGYRGLDSIVRAREALTLQLESARGMQLAFAQMQSDCEHLATPGLLQGRPYLLAAPDRLTLVRSVYNENDAARLQVVTYRVAERMLTRRESNGTRDLVQLDVMWQAAISNADTSPSVTLQSGVSAMQVMMWENNGWRQNTQPVAQAVTNAQLLLLQQQQQQQGTVPPGVAPTGLQVQLQVDNVAAVMTKFFLLGGM
ncbi:prepilin-type N-terminal cleavage/methylation domain-containing protein [Massilia violaceinigra]|uniref:Prepilin-type N-terminal cleavage/methylation domain-containing protein n=1 Tax=Massilia violaceinigra TaxID=2045208 RepID=A0ABY4ACD4_9BURK|nr:prepilin-type N-terminal cleavage/methylation domain-containing protein [Massilia violaceinigra]UOD32450.1 prepilin-type N-terminal cleavage/methylation domain-containing protein [Massilia violaceinigra]